MWLGVWEGGWVIGVGCFNPIMLSILVLIEMRLGLGLELGCDNNPYGNHLKQNFLIHTQFL